MEISDLYALETVDVAALLADANHVTEERAFNFAPCSYLLRSESGEAWQGLPPSGLDLRIARSAHREACNQPHTSCLHRVLPFVGNNPQANMENQLTSVFVEPHD